MTKASIPQGTRDFGPETVRKRQFILQTLRDVFELYGFEPLETPAMENLETLTGKYGEEGDKLIFKILNNGLSDPKNAEKAKLAFNNILEGKSDKNLTERALRYDLTIPFARFVAMNHVQLPMPFKRYQIQPVWRADRPQKGRYREFYQCDADVVGSSSPLYDLELANLYADAFSRLNIPVTIHVNSRHLLAGLAEATGSPDKLTDITTAIDKLDKIGLDKVKEELFDRGLSEKQVAIIVEYLSIDGSNDEVLTKLSSLISGASVEKGIEELRQLVGNKLAPTQVLRIDLTLARGLNYYTGIIFEVKANEVSMGSIGGGGRYDNLTGLFGVPNIAGVGISFGVDRIYDVMEELKAFPEQVATRTRVLFFNLGVTESHTAFALVQQLRGNNIPAELYPDTSKFDKQFKYADKKHIPFIAIIGEKELASKVCNIKNLATGVQEEIAFDKVLNFFEKK